MGSGDWAKRRSLLPVLVVAVMASSAASITALGSRLDWTGSISDTSRRLLQTRTQCTVDLEHLNYTILTSRCKGPRYPRDQCCDAFLQLACPYADQINDLNTTCAQTLFSYININGKYPAGLFANICQGDKNGIPCPPNYTQMAPPPASGGNAVYASSKPLSGALIPGFLFFMCILL